MSNYPYQTYFNSRSVPDPLHHRPLLQRRLLSYIAGTAVIPLGVPHQLTWVAYHTVWIRVKVFLIRLLSRWAEPMNRAKEIRLGPSTQRYLLTNVDQKPKPETHSPKTVARILKPEAQSSRTKCVPSVSNKPIG